MTVEAYPLCWPEGWPHTESHKRERSRFNTSPDLARRNLLNEIKRLIGKYYFKRSNVIISTNIKLRLDGEPHMSQRTPDEPGVAVYFEYKKKPMVFACDRWSLVHDNLHSIGKTIEALRGIERWGASDMLERAFTGFEQLPSPGTVGSESWQDVLQVGNQFTFEECEKNYKTLAFDYHPDKPTGSNERMQQLNWARRKAREFFNKP